MHVCMILWWTRAMQIEIETEVVVDGWFGEDESRIKNRQFEKKPHAEKMKWR